MKISSPEILYLCACALFITKLHVFAFIFLGLGVAGSCVRTIIETQLKNEKNALRKEIFNSKVSMIGMFVETLSETIKNAKIGAFGRGFDEDEYN